MDILSSKSNKVGKQIILKYQVSQNERDANLLKSLNPYLGSGNYYKGVKYNRGDFRIQKLNDIFSIVIPFFKKFPIHGVKLLDFEDFCKVAELIKNKAHLNPSGLEEIAKIKSGMNRARYN